MKPCKPRVQRTLGVCERGNPAGVQVDLSPIGRATSKTVGRRIYSPLRLHFEHNWKLNLHPGQEVMMAQIAKCHC
jgi:hypothetical protein